MSWSAEMLEGILLGATILDDPGAEKGRSGLCPALAKRTESELREGPSTRKERLARVKTLAAGTRIRAEMGESLNPRARALVAVDVPREVGQQWFDEAPQVRRGYRAPAGLRRAIRTAAHSATGSSTARTRSELEEIEASLGLASGGQDSEETL